MKKQILIFLILPILFSCSKEMDTVWQTSARNEQFDYTIKYDKKSAGDSEELDQDNLLNLILEITPLNHQDLISSVSANTNEKSHVINYLSFGLKDDIKLVTTEDTLGVSFLHFERSFDLKKSRIFHLTFELPHQHMIQPIQLAIDSEFLGNEIGINLKQLEISRL